MPIDIYLIKFSPPCRAVLMTAKELNIELNVKTVDLSEGQHLNDDYLKLNPAHTVPTINDNGFVLWESRAIMRYLCNKYAPNSPLYPKDPEQRALVDRWLDTDLALFNVRKEAKAKPLFGIPATEQTIKAADDAIKFIDQLIGDRKYLVGDHLTIADLSLLAITSWGSVRPGAEGPETPNLDRWLSGLKAQLPFFDEINMFEQAEFMEFVGRMRQFVAKHTGAKP